LEVSEVADLPRHARFAAAVFVACDAVGAAIVVDRLTFGGQIIETGTTSYRLAHCRTNRSAAS